MKLLVISPIDPATLAGLERAYDVVCAVNAEPVRLAEAIHDRDVIILRSGVQLSADVLSAASQLRVIVRAGSGLDNIDIEFARTRGIRVLRVPGMSALPVAEFTFALLLSLSRNVCLADRLLRQGHWPKADLGGALMRGKTLGVVGAGNIGSMVGQMGNAWGMRALGCVADPTPTVNQHLAERGVTLTTFEHIIDEADFVSLHVPLTPRTRHMVNADVLSKMKVGSLLVNMARGGVVDEAALLDQLERRSTVAGAALDVHEREGEGTFSAFSDHPNVVLTPHIGAMALDSQRLIGDRVTELIQAFAEGHLDTEVRDDEHVA